MAAGFLGRFDLCAIVCGGMGDEEKKLPPLADGTTPAHYDFVPHVSEEPPSDVWTAEDAIAARERLEDGERPPFRKHGAIEAVEELDDYGRPRGSLARNRSYTVRPTTRRCGFRLKRSRCFCDKCGTKELQRNPDRCSHCGSTFSRVEHRFCQKWPLKGRRYCSLHKAFEGGSEHHLYVDGQKSKYREFLPEKLLSMFDENSNVANVLANYEEITLLDVRIADLLTKLEDSASEDNWKRARFLTRQLTRALQSQDSETIVRSVEQMQKLMESAKEHDSTVWSEVRKTVEQRRRIVETERKTIEAEAAYMRQDELLFFAAQFAQLAHEFVEDEKRAEFANRLRKMLFGEQERMRKRQEAMELIDVTPVEEELDVRS
jgi:predicted amidophosphoribosyltransferase